MSVLIETSFGDITVDLWTHKCPNATLNFIKLCKMKHYNNALFATVQKNHTTRVIPQEPTTIWQLISHDPKLKFFNDEIDHELKFKELGYLATANRGPDMNNSQFFITLTKADLSSMNGKHTVFGKVEEGFDILRKINDSFCDKDNRPQMNIRILHTFVLEDPFDDLPQMEIPGESPVIVRDSNRLEAIEHLEMLQKYEKQQNINEQIKKQKAKKQAVTLEMLGDLPDANIKPPQNILFVCKLNPITQQRDLEIIFSRFGPIKSVQIVRDWKTGQSLQYGFIQFETSMACEQAYLKMNNVLIDDRRIQVDFSQSVSKLMPKNRKPNEPQKKMVREQDHVEKKDKLVKTGRNIEDHRYSMITSKPDYRAANKYERRENTELRRSYVEKGENSQQRKQQKRKDVKEQRMISEDRFEVKRDYQSVSRKKDKHKNDKKHKRSSSRSSSSQVQCKRKSDSEQSERSRREKKKWKQIEKQRKKQKKDKKDKKQKKGKKEKKDNKQHKRFSNYSD